MRLKIQAYLCKNCCKQEFSKGALFWYNLNPKGIIIFPYNDKQFILLTCKGKIIPNYIMQHRSSQIVLILKEKVFLLLSHYQTLTYAIYTLLPSRY